MAASEYKPDCGYAWVVVAACFAINFIMTGLTRAAGVLYIALIGSYGVSREVATTPFSLRFCLRNASGPLVGALGQRFGIRPVILLGGLICGLGGILSALAPDVTWITAAWGGVHGFGYGMCNLIHVIVINRYFHKYKGLALGISLTGDCIGTFLLPLVLEFLLTTYDLRGTFLILAGISLNVVPAAMLLKSPPWERKVTSPSLRLQNEIEFTEFDDKNSKQGIENEAYDNTSEDYSIKRGLNNIQFILPAITIDEPDSKDDSSKMQQTGNSEVVGVDTNEKINTKQSYMQYIDFWFNDRSKNNFINDVFNNDIYSLRQSSSLRVTDKSIKKKRLRCNLGAFNARNRQMSVSSVLSCPSMGKSALNSRRKSSISIHGPSPYEKLFESSKHKVYMLNQNQNSCVEQRHDKDDDNAKEILSVKKAIICNNQLQTELNLSVIHIPPQETFVEVKLREGSYEDGREANKFPDESNSSVKNALVNFVNTNTKPIFLMICLTMALCCFFFISVFTVIMDYANDNGVPIEYGKYLIIAFSVTDCLGRIGLGVVLDKKWISLSHFAGLTVGVMGLCMATIPFYKCFAFWILSCSVCGAMIGGTAIMFPLLVEHYMDKNEETVALGCLNFYGGILMLPIPPMIGYFRDNIGSYDGVFWTVGVFCIFGASLWLFEPCLMRNRRRKQTEVTSYCGVALSNQRDI